MKLFREVKESERLPEEDGEYHTSQGRMMFRKCFPGFGAIATDIQPSVWLEPIEITEEEIKRVITEEMEEGAFGANVIDHFVPKLTKAILSKLKGE